MLFPGDLLCADRRGVLSGPKVIVAKVPSVPMWIIKKKRKVIELCQSPDFSLERLREAVKVRVQLLPFKHKSRSMLSVRTNQTSEGVPNGEASLSTCDRECGGWNGSVARVLLNW
jgi:hypothetical protein